MLGILRLCGPLSFYFARAVRTGAAEPTRPMDALVLLEQWQGEHERNELGLHQYAKQKELLLRALQERTIATQDLHEETVAIKKKTVLAAGTAALQLHLIDQCEREGRVLDGETRRLTEETRLKEAGLEQLRTQAANEATSWATSLPQRRAEHRRCCKDSAKHAKRTRTELEALEAELTRVA